MLRSRARELLLSQHARIRDHLAAAAKIAAQILAHEADPGDLLPAAGALLTLLNQHNAAEEAILSPLFASDALGPLRAGRMFEEHLGEHVAFGIALSGSPRDIAGGFADFADELLGHMDAEERTFLSAGVLRDHPATNA